MKMRDQFPGFYKRTEEELSLLWRDGVFVFDTNMLLNVYRYTQKTRDRYFEILRLLKQKNQLWIPYQAAYEYQDRRFEVIQGQLDAYTNVSNILQTTRQKLENGLDPYQNRHGFMDAARILSDLNEAIKNAKDKVTNGRDRNKREFEALKRNDRHLEMLEEILQGIIGSPYEGIKLEEVYRKAQQRIDLKIPPGWEDEDKKDYRRYGDTVLWFQIMDFVSSKRKPIIFVTDDGKKDWWAPEAKSQERNRPLPELVQEIFVNAGVLFHMYTGGEFLKQAENYLRLEKQPDVSEEAEKVTQDNIMELDQKKHGGPSVYSGFYVHKAVQSWLEASYPEHDLMIEPRTQNQKMQNPRIIDFLLIDQYRRLKIGVEVKHFAGFITKKDIDGLVGLAYDYLSDHYFDKFIVVIVADDVNQAFNINNNINTRIIKFGTSFPLDCSLVIGYIDGDAFSPLFNLPN